MTGLVDEAVYGGATRPQFKEYLSTLDPAQVCDLSQDVGSWDDEERGIDSRPVLISGGHGTPRNWTVPAETFWLGVVGDTTGTDGHNAIELGRRSARGAFICSCQVFGKGAKRKFFSPRDDAPDYYTVEPSMVSDLSPAFGEGLIGVCGFSTYVSCSLVALAQPFDLSAWRGADTFEGFMSAGIVSKNWPVVPACAVRVGASGKPQPVSALGAFAGARPASQRWVARYVEWIHYPEPVSLRSLLTGATAAPAGDVPAKLAGGPLASYVEVARARLRGPRREWNGAAGIALVKVADESGAQTAGAETVVVIRAEEHGKPLVNVQPGLVWFDEKGEVKFAGGGSEIPPDLVREIDAKDDEDFLDRAKAALGCPGDAPSQLMPGVMRGGEGGAFARVECVRTDSVGQSYMEGGLFRFRLLGAEPSAPP